MQLLNAILERPDLENRSILLLDADDDVEKTWCFWEKGKGKWDEILHFQWNNGQFVDEKGTLNLKMYSYAYKMIRSSDFRAYFQKQIDQIPNIELRKEKVLKVDLNTHTIQSSQSEYSAKYIFDSRFDPDELKQTKLPTVLQHFKGWFVKANSEIFDPNEFVMMDFRAAYKDHCSFIYILPFSKKEALVEFTFFSPDLVSENTYDELIEKYLAEKYPTQSFEVTNTEKGIIPMSTYAYDQFNTKHYCRIGTAGGWVKSSSGYSFKHAEKKSALIAENLSLDKRLDDRLFKKRFKFYDRTFLSILQNENSLGNSIFCEMYRKNETTAIFRFLDEDSSLAEELKIIGRFNPSPFIRAVRRELF